MGIVWKKVIGTLWVYAEDCRVLGHAQLLESDNRCCEGRCQVTGETAKFFDEDQKISFQAAQKWVEKSVEDTLYDQ